MSKKEYMVHASVKTERLDTPSMTEGRIVEVVFVVTDEETREGKGSATFRFSANKPEMPRGAEGDLYYITQAQRFFKLCAEADAINRPDLRSGNKGAMLVMTPLDVRIKSILEDE